MIQYNTIQYNTATKKCIVEMEDIESRPCAALFSHLIPSGPRRIFMDKICRIPRQPPWAKLALLTSS